MLILQAVLVFQLTVGMALPAAHASVSSHEAGNVRAERCPEHASLDENLKAGDAETAPLGGSSDRVSAEQGKPDKAHDCCRSAGCQCHCTYTPMIMSGPVATLVVASAVHLPLADRCVTSARPDQLFRPPIA
jgi:hypothetical protein